MIFKCLRIWKERDYSVSKGDVGYLEDKDLPEIIVKARFFLEDVKEWHEHTQYDYFENKEKKVSVIFDHRNTNIILLSIEEFDNVMEEFHKTKLVKFKDN